MAKSQIKNEQIITLAALGVAIVAIILALAHREAVGSGDGGNSTLGGNVLGAPSFNFNQSPYAARNAYPDTNSCGCGGAKAAGYFLSPDYSSDSIQALNQPSYPGLNLLASNDPSRPAQVQLAYSNDVLSTGTNFSPVNLSGIM